MIYSCFARGWYAHLGVGRRAIGSAAETTRQEGTRTQERLHHRTQATIADFYGQQLARGKRAAESWAYNFQGADNRTRLNVSDRGGPTRPLGTLRAFWGPAGGVGPRGFPSMSRRIRQQTGFGLPCPR